MFYGTVILFFSMLLAVLVRLKSGKEFCIAKKILPYLILLSGGVLATFVVILNR